LWPVLSVLACKQGPILMLQVCVVKLWKPWGCLELGTSAICIDNDIGKVLVDVVEQIMFLWCRVTLVANRGILSGISMSSHP